MSALRDELNDYAQDSDRESALSQAMRELNPAGSSMTHNQAREAAEDTGLCSDGFPCGEPNWAGDPVYCLGCPNTPDEAEPIPQAMRELADRHPAPITAASIIRAGLGHMEDRAATYDKPQGERSMVATVRAFSATTGIELTEEQGWHFMALLKLVRSQQGGLRMDCYEDGAAYFGLMGEAAAKERGE